MANNDRSDLSVVAVRGERHARGAAADGKRGSGLASPDDALNQQIVRLLQEDGRRPFNEIATVLNVSEGTIRNRVNGMRQAGHMQIVAIVDPGALEYRTDAIVCIRVGATSTPTAVAARLGQLDEVVYVLWVTGRFDLMIEMVTDEPDGLSRFLEDHIHDQPDIAEAETMMGLKNFKNRFLLKQNWG